MTDNEIIKALECCSSQGLLNCSHCPYDKLCETDDAQFMLDAIDLIKRQKAEIERFADIGKMYSEIRKEAIKEFAEKLSKRIQEKAATIEHPIGRAIFLKELLKIINDLSAEINKNPEEIVGEENA